MAQKANHFKIGLFIVAAVALAIVGVILLGVGALFQPTIEFETYIDESVQGLDVGSAVRYRGVKVGNVREIGIVDEYYDTNKQYVIVIVALQWEESSVRREARLSERKLALNEIARLVERGLRVRLAPKGITGGVYLETDFLDPDRYPSLEIDWEPRTYYVPSAPSAIRSFTESADSILRNLENTEIDTVTRRMDELLVSVREAVENARVGALSDEAVGLLSDLRETNRRAQRVLSQPGADQITSETQSLLVCARRLVENVNQEATAMLKGFRKASDKLELTIDEMNRTVKDENLKRSLEGLAHASDRMSEAADRLPDTVSRLDRVLRRVDQIVFRQERQVDAIMDNARGITENVRDLSHDARRHPSRILFGDPPPPLER